MGNVVVGISDMAVSKDPDVLATYALGSCVGICLYDKSRKIGGLSHILLPQSNGNAKDSPMKFADTAVPLLIAKLVTAGASKVQLTAKIVGGAQMFATSGNGAIAQIGQRNTAAVKEQLRKAGIRIIGEDTGLDYGRTVFMDLATGKVKIKTAFGEVSEL